MPWKTLELDPAVATERDVKRAYAKRLKSCRPDQDPEGFRRLYDAYTSALAELQWRSADDSAAAKEGEAESSAPFSIEPAWTATATAAEAAPAERSSPGATPRLQASAIPRDLSPARQAVGEAFTKLEAALKSDSTDVADRVRAAEAVLFAHPDEVIAWGQAMHQLFQRHGDHSDLRLKPEAMLFELEHEGLGATLAVIDRLDRQGSIQGIVNLANLLMEHRQRIATPTGGLAAAHLAGVAAFWVRRHAEPLANFAYEHLNRGERDFHMQLIDRHRSMGHFLNNVPGPLVSFWRQALIKAPDRSAWQSEVGQEALGWLRGSGSRRNPAFQMLRDLVPQEFASSLRSTKDEDDAFAPLDRSHRSPIPPSRTNSRSSGKGSRASTSSWEEETEAAQAHRARRTAVRRQPSYYSSSSGASSSGASPRWLLWLIIPVIKLIFLAAQCSNAPIDLPAAPPTAAQQAPVPEGQESANLPPK